MNCRLLRYELNRAFLNPWFFLTLALCCGFGIACAVVAYVTFEGGQAGKLVANEWLGFSVGGAYGLWMGVGGDTAVPLRYVFFIVAPLLATMPYAWSYRSDLIDGTASQVAARVGKRHYLWARSVAVFLTAFVSIASAYLVNFAILACLVPLYTPDIAEVLSLAIQSPMAWSSLFYTRPLLYVVVNSVANAALCGLWALLVLALSTRIDNRVVLLALPYVALLVWSHYGEEVIFDVNQIGGIALSLINTLDCVALGSYPRTIASIAIQAAAMAVGSGFLLSLQRKRDVL